MSKSKSYQIADWLIIALAGCLALTLFQVWEWTRTGGQIGVPLIDAAGQPAGDRVLLPSVRVAE